MKDKKQLTAVSGNSHTYDANGNLTAISPYKVLTYDDDENQLVQRYNDPAVYGSSATNTDFVYDGNALATAIATSVNV